MLYDITYMRTHYLGATIVDPGLSYPTYYSVPKKFSCTQKIHGMFAKSFLKNQKWEKFYLLSELCSSEP